MYYINGFVCPTNGGLPLEGKVARESRMRWPRSEVAILEQNAGAQPWHLISQLR